MSPAERSLLRRLMQRSEFSTVNSCREWTGALDSHGYGSVWTSGRSRGAHRVMYELLRGPVPRGMQVDHLCRNRRCVNIHHLEMVSQRENILRGESIAVRHAARTHCPKGHAFTAENTIKRKVGDGRRCRACERTRDAKRREVAHG